MTGSPSVQPGDRVELVFHRGAKKRTDSNSFTFVDPSGRVRGPLPIEGSSPSAITTTCAPRCRRSGNWFASGCRRPPSKARPNGRDVRRMVVKGMANLAVKVGGGRPRIRRATAPPTRVRLARGGVLDSHDHVADGDAMAVATLDSCGIYSARLADRSMPPPTRATRTRRSLSTSRRCCPSRWVYRAAAERYCRPHEGR